MRRQQGHAVVIQIDVECKHDPVRAETPQPVANGIGLGHRQAADDTTGDAGRVPGLERLDLANAAAELNFEFRLGRDGRDEVAIHLLAGARAVEIDDVQVCCLHQRKRPGNGKGIVTVFGGLVEVSLVEPNALAALQINRGNDVHVHSPTKLCSSRAPANEERSG